MTAPDEAAARLTLKIAGVFQEKRDIWVRRLDQYFQQLESLVNGQWLDHSDITGIINESRKASREALDGLGTDLSSELLHVSNGIFTRFETDRVMLLEQIGDLKESLRRTMSEEEMGMQEENKVLKEVLMSMPLFKVLKAAQGEGMTTYKDLSKASGISKGKLRKYVKELVKRGYMSLNKDTRPHTIKFLSAPWFVRSQETEEDQELTVTRKVTHMQAELS